MNGTTADTVASSWIEALGGESMCWIFEHARRLLRGRG